MSDPSYHDLPSISALLADPSLADLPHAVAVRAARAVVDEARAGLREGLPIPPDLAERVARLARASQRPHLRRAINATGIVLHTNMGRAPLAPEAARAVAEVAAGYSNVELDLDSGLRGERLDAISGLVRELTGAEGTVAVNNNAAAVLLTLTALGRDREVIVSRGELVEIGGSFRIPEVIAAGGARLVEVGATNRTHLRDYAEAITDQTAMLLRVHRSNFRIQGFTSRPDRPALAQLAHEHGLPLVEDLGSGLLGQAPTPIAADELEREAVDRALREGADLVSFSGDKLLGGPQAGLVVGDAVRVAALRRHPLYRALRLDKLVLAALEATLRLYAEGRADEIPTRARLGRTEPQCEALARQILAQVPGGALQHGVAYAGGGALPARSLPGWVAAWTVAHPEQVAADLRAQIPPIVTRVAHDTLIADPRALDPHDLPELVAGLNAVLAVHRARG